MKKERSVVKLKVFCLDKGEYFMDKMLLKFRLLSNLLVLQKVVYLSHLAELR